MGFVGAGLVVESSSSTIEDRLSLGLKMRLQESLEVVVEDSWRGGLKNQEVVDSWDERVAVGSHTPLANSTE